MTRKMIFEFLTNIRNTVLLFLLILGLGGCEFFAFSFAPGKGNSRGWIRLRTGLSSIYSPLVIRWVQKNIPTLNSVKPLTCNGKISISASMTTSTETILTSQTILKWNLQKNGNLIREHAGIHGLPPIIYRDSSWILVTCWSRRASPKLRGRSIKLPWIIRILKPGPIKNIWSEE